MLYCQVIPTQRRQDTLGEKDFDEVLSGMKGIGGDLDVGFVDQLGCELEVLGIHFFF